jgi:SagB-type dehydrogenase family enzyme
MNLLNPFLAALHADLRGTRLTRRGATHLPPNVPRGTHKIYPRMPRIVLPEPRTLDTSLADALAGRRSGSPTHPGVPLLLDDVATMLGLALRKKVGTTRRQYPSGGGLYPVETYLISTAIESQTPAAFHYDPTAHALERLWDLPPDFNIKMLGKWPDQLQFSNMIVFTSVWHRSAAKYGDLAYQHALLEAGHMSENVLLVAGALGLSVRPYSGFDDILTMRLLDLDEESEQPVHAIIVSKGAHRDIPTTEEE